MTFSDLKALRPDIQITREEMLWREDTATVPFKITRHFASLIDADDPSDPIRRQSVPTCLENSKAGNYETLDPQQEEQHLIAPRLVHRYQGTAAFLTTDYCAMYCRHCFRRRFTGGMAGPAADQEIQAAAKALSENLQIKEVLLTGGDVLTLSHDQLRYLISSFRQARPDLVLRVCTRIPIVDPDRIDASLIQLLESFDTAPFYVMLQVNHPRELTDKALIAVRLFTDSGFPVLDQTVLLKGVNDNVLILKELFEKCIANRIIPYYLFQADLVSGTASFRVPLSESLRIYKDLKPLLSGLAYPKLALDLPNGGGKVNFSTDSYIEEDGWFLFDGPDGRKHRYPKD